MSRVRADNLTNRAGTGAPSFPYGATVTSTGTTALLVQGDARITGILSIGQGTVTIDGDTNTVTATNIIVTNNITQPGGIGYATEGYVTQQIDSLIAGAPGALDTLNELAAALNDDASFSTTVTNSLATKISGVGIQSAGSLVGSGITTLNFVGSGNTFAINGTTVDISISGGGGGGGTIATEAISGGSVTLDLTAAQDHKVTATGITTITVSGGTEGDSHTVRIVNSGIATVGFSTYFLFPSGSPPVLPTASGAISLVSFTVNQVGAAGTQLLAGASLNFS